MDNNNNANVLNMTFGKYPFKAKLKNMTTNVNKGILVISHRRKQHQPAIKNRRKS